MSYWNRSGPEGPPEGPPAERASKAACNAVSSSPESSSPETSARSVRPPKPPDRSKISRGASAESIEQSSDGDPDLVPGVAHSLALDRPGPEEPLRRAQGGCGEGPEARRGPQRPVEERLVPDLPRPLPGGPAECRRGEVEGVVGDAGVGVHAAIVLDRVHVVTHVGRLAVAFEGGSGSLHRAQRDTLERGAEDPFADQPVGLVGLLAELVLLDERAEHVGDRLVQSAGLAEVEETERLLRHPVRQLVADDVDRLGEPGEKLAVAVAEHHPLAVPEGVVVVLSEMDLAE